MWGSHTRPRTAYVLSTGGELARCCFDWDWRGGLTVITVEIQGEM